MDEAVSAAEANRSLSRILRRVREGRSYIVTSDGRPVARIVPINSKERFLSGARAALLTRLRSQAVVASKAWTRNELHEDEG